MAASGKAADRAGAPVNGSGGVALFRRAVVGGRAAWRLVRSVGQALRGACVCAVVFPFVDATARMRHVRDWSRAMLRVLGIELRVSGPEMAGQALLVANHVSWLDILAINAIAPVRFVSKADVRAWPVLGFMVARGGTLFIERHRRRDALRVVHDVAEALRQGDRVAVFPEGTTGEGAEVLVFHANLMQAAIVTARPVQPVALRYSDASSAFSAQAAYVGETTLLASLWRVATGERLQAHVAVLPLLDSQTADRRSLAERARTQIQAALDHAPSVSTLNRRPQC